MPALKQQQQHVSNMALEPCESGCKGGQRRSGYSKMISTTICESGDSGKMIAGPICNMSSNQDLIDALFTHVQNRPRIMKLMATPSADNVNERSLNRVSSSQESCLAIVIYLSRGTANLSSVSSLF